MKNYLLLILIVGLIFFNGCSSSDINQSKEPEIVVELSHPFPVANSRLITNDEANIITEYFGKLHRKNILNLENAIISSYENISGLSITIPVIDEAKDIDSELFYILFMNTNNEIVDLAMFERNKFETYDEVNIYDNTDKLLTTIIDNESNEIISIETFKSGSKGRWSDCFKCATTSCVNDSECAFLCGTIVPECLAAIAAACVFSSLSC